MGVADVRHHSFLTSVPDEVSGQLRYTAALLPGYRSPITLNRRLYGPRAGLDILEKKKSLFSSRNQTTILWS